MLILKLTIIMKDKQAGRSFKFHRISESELRSLNQQDSGLILKKNLGGPFS